MSTVDTSATAASQLAPHPPTSTIRAESLEMSDLAGSQIPHAEPSQQADLKTETIDNAVMPSSSTQPAHLVRGETAEVFLGADGATPSSAAIDSADPILRITLMLITGARHPYTISNRYLTSRKVTAVDAAGNFDPREMSAYKLKELIWTDWRQEWEPKPRDPAAIRLIIMGRMLDDNTQLKELPFSMEQTNVVHMTVKPADLLDDDAEGAGKTGAKSIRGRGLSEGESAGCCRCILQ